MRYRLVLIQTVGCAIIKVLRQYLLYRSAKIIVGRIAPYTCAQVRAPFAAFAVVNCGVGVFGGDL